MNDVTFGQSSFTNLDFSDDVCLPAELRVLDLLLPALATEAASLGLDVNWQCTRKGIPWCFCALLHPEYLGYPLTQCC